MSGTVQEDRAEQLPETVVRSRSGDSNSLHRQRADADGTRGARMTLRFGEAVDDHERAIREGYQVWWDGGIPPERYRSADIRFGSGVGSRAFYWLR